MTPHRQLPEKPAAMLPILANDEMERLALKTLLMGRYEMESAVAALHPDTFYHPKNRAVYDAVLSIVKRGERPDLMKVTEEMQTPEMRKAGVLPEELSGLFVFDSSEDLSFLNHRHGVNVAVFDYLQIMSVQQVRRNDTTEQLLAHAARELHNLAKDLGIAILAISQLNRDREDSEPQLSRLRDSSQIADAADAVILLYRPERYGKSYTGQFRACDTRNTALVKVAKMRQGATGDFICGFNPQQTRFYNLDRPPVFDVNPNDVFGI